MIQTNRTFLRELKEKKRAITANHQILKARRHALILEFLNTSRPFVKSREEIRGLYRNGLQELNLSIGREGSLYVESLALLSANEDTEITITEKNILGVRYKDIQARGVVQREPDAWPHDWRTSTPHVEETIHLFEKTVAAMINLASHELKLKKLAEAINTISRRTRMLEERIMPRLQKQIKKVSQYIGEREREEFYRLKKFKELRVKHVPPFAQSAPQAQL